MCHTVYVFCFVNSCWFVYLDLAAAVGSSSFLERAFRRCLETGTTPRHLGILAANPLLMTCLTATLDVTPVARRMAPIPDEPFYCNTYVPFPPSSHYHNKRGPGSPSHNNMSRISSCLATSTGRRPSSLEAKRSAPRLSRAPTAHSRQWYAAI